ncbi:sulfurtransferase [Ornithinibacillus sp. L9]|uniref:Sulfurtransferase n=1 Tax=Ornithinibacillus caprae TaxID=2678566 RepID=A0A6N8FQH1_9BACI|nr:sulfurtransferase [Ornithinibacillus caprae]MUK89828.1 sulfurtransferase [Ornithinibacillus caprae]
MLMRVEQLVDRLNNHEDETVVVDVRFQLNDTDAGRKAYVEGHIPGAVYLDLNKDLSGEVQKHGGNHPLPDSNEFSSKLGEIGIDHGTTVVVYDQQNDMFASRLWWLLQYMGHEKVYVLDGGYQCWVKQGNKVSVEIPTYAKKNFIPKVNEDEVVDIRKIKENIMSSNAVLIDSRSKERYLGKVEPLYAKAGHIPGARNFFWKEVLHEDGSWKDEDTLKEHFSSLDKGAEIIVSCGSGVSACPNILALKRIGFTNVKLYPGSYSDWISYEENRVETKDE